MRQPTTESGGRKTYHSPIRAERRDMSVIDKNLKCPNCGFAMGMIVDDDELTEADIIDLMTCPCGTLMEETETLEAIMIGGAE